ncbi:MAG: DUF4831 family protein [Bacteroidales bacterium]|jgi:hypothetical protein|nr:DUF4831 family protein [Bacteroidales bacterium]
MKKIIIFIASILIFTTVFAQNQVAKLPLDPKIKINNSYFVYQLPQTVVRVQVMVTKSESYPGLYAEWAEQMLNIDHVIKEKEVTYRVKEVGIGTQIIGDATHRYLVELSKNQMSNHFLDKLYESSPANVSVASYSKNYQPKIAEAPSFFKNFANIILKEVEEVYTETQVVDSVVTYVPKSITKTVSKSTEIQAREAADFITKVRNSRFELLSGAQETPYSQEALNYMKLQLDTLESNYLQLFTGYTIESVQHYTISLTPTNLDKQFIFSFDSSIGVDINRNSHKNYFLEFAPLNGISEEVMISSNHGYTFRKAAPTTITLTDDQTKIQELGIFPIFQFGKIITLPILQDNFSIGDFIVVE